MSYSNLLNAHTLIGALNWDSQQRALVAFGAVAPFSLLVMLMLELNGLSAILLHSIFAVIFGTFALVNPLLQNTSDLLWQYFMVIPVALGTGIVSLAYQWI